MTRNLAGNANLVYLIWARNVIAASMFVFSSLAFSQELDGTPSYTYAVLAAPVFTIWMIDRFLS